MRHDALRQAPLREEIVMKIQIGKF